MKHISEIIEAELSKLEDFERNRQIGDYVKEWEWEQHVRKYPAARWDNWFADLDDDTILGLEDFPGYPSEPGEIDEADLPY